MCLLKVTVTCTLINPIVISQFSPSLTFKEFWAQLPLSSLKVPSSASRMQAAWCSLSVFWHVSSSSWILNVSKSQGLSLTVVILFLFTLISKVIYSSLCSNITFLLIIPIFISLTCFWNAFSEYFREDALLHAPLLPPPPKKKHKNTALLRD